MLVVRIHSHIDVKRVLPLVERSTQPFPQNIPISDKAFDGNCQENTLPKEARKPRVILTTPQGDLFTQRTAERWAKEEALVFLCGHYEGFDERVRELYVTEEVSIGDFVLTGGELATMVMIDATVRLLPGVLGGERSALEDSFSRDRLEYPHYTRPKEFRGLSVPEVLLSGHHERIRLWRKKQALLRTLHRRPDLLEKTPPDEEEERWLGRWTENNDT